MPRPDHSYFAIFGAMRTGSNLLERSLDCFEGLSGHGELFNEFFIGHPNAEPPFGATLAERNADPIGFLRRVISDEPDIPGFRIFPEHDARVADFAARDPACAKIILHRNPIDSFISLKIARETGQWMLTREENRRLVKVRFDRGEFEDYRDALTAHYAQLRRKMRQSGQVAFDVDYDELRNAEVLNGIAAFIGAKEELPNIPQKIHRQNPPAWEDKVTNPEALRKYVADGEPPRRAAPPSQFSAMDNLVASRGFSLIYAPVPGAGADAIRPFIRDAEIVAGVSGKPLATGLNEAHIERRRRRGGFVFSFVRHPALRVLDVFRKRFVATGEGTFSGIRETLMQTYGCPPPEEMGESDAALGAGLDAFIAFIADSLAGRTALRVDPGWVPQVSLLADYARETPPDFVGRCERASEDLSYVLHRLGVPDEDAALSTSAAQRLEVDPGDLMTPAREEKVLKIYERDYARLGYAPLI